MSNQMYKRTFIYLVFVGPMLILFTTFIFLPFLRSIIYSFQDWNGISSQMNWIGWENYRKVWKDTSFLNTLSFTIRYAATTVVTLNVLG